MVGGRREKAQHKHRCCQIRCLTCRTRKERCDEIFSPTAKRSGNYSRLGGLSRCLIRSEAVARNDIILVSPISYQYTLDLVASVLALSHKQGFGLLEIPSPSASKLHMTQDVEAPLINFNRRTKISGSFYAYTPLPPLRLPWAK
ncbi:hypothetical protein ACQKWADRAFT_300864 [Trichoderma austrokoningii]